MLDRLRIPVRFKPFYKRYRTREFRLLDVGCGFGSPTTTLRYFPRCHYYGIDRERGANTEKDVACMKHFYELDLEQDSLDEVPSLFFDVIIFSHVIEHLQ